MPGDTDNVGVVVDSDFIYIINYLPRAMLLRSVMPMMTVFKHVIWADDHYIKYDIKKPSVYFPEGFFILKFIFLYIAI